MKGIILAGGQAKRLYPLTKAVGKQLLPIYDKPMIYYPLSVLMLAGIKDILIISTPNDIEKFKDLLGTGKNFGLKINYAIQRKPKGVAEALLIGESFIGRSNFSLILGDNLFYGQNFTEILKKATTQKKGSTIFTYYVKNPQRYGVVEVDKKYRIKTITEKPKKPKSNWVITGLYFFDAQAVQFAKKLKKSKRGELEITDIIQSYLKAGQLNMQMLGRGYTWLDTGTYESLSDASIFIKTIEERQGQKIGCIEEIAYRKRYIRADQLLKLANSIKNNYGNYLEKLVHKKNGHAKQKK